MRLLNKSNSISSLRLVEFIYLSLFVISFYLLFASRSDEVYTIWSTVHPAFIFVFFGATFLLVSVVLSSEKNEHKMVLCIAHGILSFSFYAVVFPFGRAGVPQMVLGEIRLVFDNVNPTGFATWPKAAAENILVQIYRAARGFNFEALTNVISARMFGIDVYWTNLLLVPFLWAIFIPAIAFGVARELGGDKNASVLAGLMVFSSPTLVFWGTFSTHNSVGFIFFFGLVYASLKYLSSNRLQWLFLMLVLSSASFLAHFLTGVVSFSILLLAIFFRLYTRMKENAPTEASINLLIGTVVCTFLLPSFLLFHKFFFHLNTYFSLSRLNEPSVTEALSILVFGESVNFGLTNALVFGLSPFVGLVGMIHLLRSARYRSTQYSRAIMLFLFVAFLMMLVDYRIIRLFMVNVPFEEERIWVFRDLIAVPFVGLFACSIVSSFTRRISDASNEIADLIQMKVKGNAKSVVSFIIIVLLFSGWITVSVYSAYPSFAPLQTTPYEVEAVRDIEETSEARYIVVADQWMIFAGEMFVGIHNPRAFYFVYDEPEGIRLFVKMKNDPSNETLIEAMKYSNASIAYFIVEYPRLNAQEFSNVIQKAQQNRVAIHKILGDGKVYVFYYKA